MTSFSVTGRTGSILTSGRGSRDWLALAASPTFALMAWVTAGKPSALCMSEPGILPIGGMGFMYLLMSLFHLSAWLKLCAGKCGTIRESVTKGD